MYIWRFSMPVRSEVGPHRNAARSQLIDSSNCTVDGKENIRPARTLHDRNAHAIQQLFQIARCAEGKQAIVLIAHNEITYTVPDRTVPDSTKIQLKVELLLDAFIRKKIE